MNNRKLDQLWTAARRAKDPMPPDGFAEETSRLARTQPITLVAHDTSLDWLSLRAPWLAGASALFIGACVAADQLFPTGSATSIDDGLVRLAGQWLFTIHGG